MALSPTPRLARLRRVLLAVLLAAVVVAGVVYTKAEHIVLGAEGYIYGYPLVMMDLTRAAAAQAIGPETRLHRVRQFPDAERHTDLIRPAWWELVRQPDSPPRRGSARLRTRPQDGGHERSRPASALGSPTPGPIS